MIMMRMKKDDNTLDGRKGLNLGGLKLAYHIPKPSLLSTDISHLPSAIMWRIRLSIAVIAVAPTSKASFVYSYMQTRLMGQYNGK